MKKTIILSTLFASLGLGAHAQFEHYTTPAKLPGTVNQELTEESSPVFSRDSSRLYFVRTYDASNTGGEYDQDIWYSERQSDGSYSDCKLLSVLNNKYYNAVLSTNTAGDALYLLNAYSGKKDLQKGLARSEKNGTGWSKPQEVTIPGLDIDGDHYGFHVSEDETVVIISYEGPGSLGEEDFYVSEKTNGTWSTPKHMGNVINSAGYEISPFLSPGKDTLFFSSNGLGGEGGADIFYSVKQGSYTSWSKPVNLGPNINSPKFDAFFTYSDHMVYWSSNRDSERADIWMMEKLPMPDVTIACTATDITKAGAGDGTVAATINGGTSPFTIEWSNGAEGDRIEGLQKGDYTVTVTDIYGKTAEATCSVDEPVLLFEDLAMKHYFGYNKNKVPGEEEDYESFVAKVEQQLKDGRGSITIMIHSSASKVRTQTFGTNEKLAQSRADKMKSDLVAYFKAKDMLDKVNIVIEKVEVAGPEYDKDPQNKDKYRPYQFVALQTK